jgi:plastocyanin
MSRWRVVLALVLLIGTVLVAGTTMVMLGGVATASDSDTLEVLLEDDCEPNTFNAAGQAFFQQDLCEEDFEGSVTFGDYLDALVLVGGHEAWRFNPNHATIRQGESLKAINTGGEGHSFTEVEDFGGGVIPEFNELLGGLEPVPEAQDPEIFGPTILAPGDSLTVTDLEAGTHRFMCVFHPWQQSVINVTR